MTIGVCFGFCTILYAITLFVAWKQNLISSYYYCKIYYMLWPVLILMTVKAMIDFCNGSKEKNIAILCTVVYLIIFLIVLLNVKYSMNIENTLENESIRTIMQIYSLNAYMYEEDDIFSEDEMETLQYVNKNLSFEDTLFVGMQMQERWIEIMFDHSNRKNIDINDLPLQIEKWSNKQKYKYIVLYKDKYRCEQYLYLVNMEDSTLIYENRTCEIRRNY